MKIKNVAGVVILGLILALTTICLLPYYLMAAGFFVYHYTIFQAIWRIPITRNWYVAYQMRSWKLPKGVQPIRRIPVQGNGPKPAA